MSKVKGVNVIKNNLQIGRRGIGQIFGDSMMASKIKGQLMGEPSVMSLNIDVDVYNGIAILTGIVRTREEKESVLKIADETYGTVDFVYILEIVSD